MASFFYNHRYYIRRPKERKKKYKFIYDEDGFMRKVEIIPKPKTEYLQRMRRLFPDFDQWDFERQISMMGEDDAK
tara:strand:- start:100 stop:324 length:225 start_codon:yes stop_codon:yes gene_type:complete